MLKEYDEKSILKINSNNAMASTVNIVKELIDNSIDGGADTIRIELSDYGIEEISIIDNGQGINPEIYVVGAI